MLFSALTKAADVLPHGIPRDVQKFGRGLASHLCGVASQNLFDSGIRGPESGIAALYAPDATFVFANGELL